MSESKCTLGPWKVVRAVDGDYAIYSDLRMIAITDDDCPVDKANALLMAAAPDMLDLLEECEPYIAGELGKRIKAAIAKARGTA